MALSDEPPSDIEIRRMTLEDIVAVTMIDHAADLSPWSENIFRCELQIPFAQTWVAIEKQEHGDEIAGFIAFWMVADEVQLHKIVVSERSRRRGIAVKLFQSMKEQALAHGFSRTTLEVRRSNEAAIKLYEILGYRVTAVRRGYYGEAGEDAIMMAAELCPDALERH